MVRDRLIFGRKTDSFTLQWHLTNACTWHCRHCYDRSTLPVLPVETARLILWNFILFCHKRKLMGRICFSGGDPFLYPGFLALYEEVAKTGLPISVLGNPVSEALVSAITSIKKPVYYQVSLEGKKDYNDYIRGDNHYDLVIDFLKILGECGVRRTVMLTLNRDNMDQALDLAAELPGLAERFTFNRLSRVGEGAFLEVPSKGEMIDFM